MPERGGRFRLASVFAHPDDDTFGNTGVLLVGKGDVEYSAIVATSGEAGQISDPAIVGQESLGAVREAEERAALGTVGYDDATLHFLRYPDGGLADVPRTELIERIAVLLRELRPHVVITFGSEGVTKHTDHIAVGQAATEAFHDARAGNEGAEDGAFRRLLYVAVPQSRLDLARQAAKERGLDLGSPDDPFQPRGVPDHTITIRVDVRSKIDAKLAAIQAHRTQSQGTAGFPEDLIREMFAEECFVQAWPPITDPNVTVLASVFDGLAH
jgi:LmbE family N-acetylglucosaminyl deacetylase